jgi:hypothetical protein
VVGDPGIGPNPEQVVVSGTAFRCYRRPRTRDNGAAAPAVCPGGGRKPAPTTATQNFDGQCVLEAHADLPVEVRPKEGPSHLCRSPPAFGETRVLKRGVEPSTGGCKPPVRSMKRSLPRREEFLRKEPTGSRARCAWAKARDGAKRLERRPSRTPRRRGRGTVGQPAWEQERPVSAPAVRRLRSQPRRGPGAANPINGVPVKWGSAERESERPIVPTRPWQQNHGRGKGPYLVCVHDGGRHW